MFKALGNLLRKSYMYLAQTAFSMFGSGRTRDFEKLIREGYRINPIVYACVDAIAKAAAGIPYDLYKKIDYKKYEPVENALLNDLFDMPNPDQTHSDFIDGFARDYLTDGNSITRLVGRDELNPEVRRKPLTGDVLAMWPIKPDSIEPKCGPFGNIVRWEPRQDKENWIHPSRIIHIKTWNPLSRIWGMSPMEAAAQTIDTMNAGLGYIRNIFENNGQLAGLILAQGTMQPESEAQAKNQINSTFNNSANAGKWKLMTGIKEADVKELGLNPRDLQYKDVRMGDAIIICAVYGVPPEIIGIPGSKTFNTYAEARRAFYMETVFTMLDRYYEKFTVRVARPVEKKIYYDYDRDEVEAVQEDKNKKTEVALKAQQQGVITANEARRVAGEEPIKDPLSDKRMIPLNVISVEDYDVAEALPDVEDDSSEEDTEDEVVKPEPEE